MLPCSPIDVPSSGYWLARARSKSGTRAQMPQSAWSARSQGQGYRGRAWEQWHDRPLSLCAEPSQAVAHAIFVQMSHSSNKYGSFELRMQIMLTKGADSHHTNQALLIAIVVAELMQKILGDGSTKRAVISARRWNGVALVT